MSAHDLSRCEIRPNNPESLKLIQITDTHIIDDGKPLFNDFDTSASLTAVVETFSADESGVDLVLVTGDLVHEPTESAYQKLADHLASINMPIFYLPGNHDNPARLEYVMGANGFDQSKMVKIGDWLIILLNTHVSGEQHGELEQSELERLDACLNDNPNLHVLIALHHHPVSINSTWMDGMALSNPDPFFTIVDKYQHVRGIIWGHIHQAYETLRNEVQLLGTPSTCLQFSPGARSFAVDDKTPAYRTLHLDPAGGLKTAVKYIDYNLE